MLFGFLLQIASRVLIIKDRISISCDMWGRSSRTWGWCLSLNCRENRKQRQTYFLSFTSLVSKVKHRPKNEVIWLFSKYISRLTHWDLKFIKEALFYKLNIAPLPFSGLTLINWIPWLIYDRVWTHRQMRTAGLLGGLPPSWRYAVLEKGVGRLPIFPSIQWWTG